MVFTLMVSYIPLSFCLPLTLCMWGNVPLRFGLISEIYNTLWHLYLMLGEYWFESSPNKKLSKNNKTPTTKKQEQTKDLPNTVSVEKEF